MYYELFVFLSLSRSSSNFSTSSFCYPDFKISFFAEYSLRPEDSDSALGYQQTYDRFEGQQRSNNGLLPTIMSPLYPEHRESSHTDVLQSH